MAVALLAYCLKDIRLAEIRELMLKIDYFYLIPATVSAFAFIIIKGLRWKLILSQQKLINSIRAVTLYSAGAVLNIVMPMLTGQVGRLFLFSNNENLRKTVIFSTIILEVLFDAISLVVFLFLTSLAFAFPYEYRTLSIVILSITSIVVVLIYLILHNRIGLEQLGRRKMRHRWPGAYVTIRKFIRSFAKGMELLRSSQHIIGSMMYSLLSWAAHTLVVYFLLKSFGFQLPFAAAAAIMIINTLALMIPITPANAGTFELAVSSSLAAFAVSRSDAVLFALALHLLDLIPIIVLGYFYFHSQRVSIRKIRAEHVDDVVLNRVGEDGQYVEEGGSA